MGAGGQVLLHMLRRTGPTDADQLHRQAALLDDAGQNADLRDGRIANGSAADAPLLTRVHQGAAAVFLGKVTGPEMWQGLIVQAVWVLLFVFVCRWMLRSGYNRYSGFGG